MDRLSTPAEVQALYAEDLLSLDDPFLQYEYLIEIASGLPPIPEDERADIPVVKGCQSHVWLDAGCDSKRIFHLRADSDTMIVRGILRILTDMYNGSPADLVLACPFDLLAQAGIASLFSSERQSGIAAIMRDIDASCTTGDSGRNID